tara:strand:+ start:1310 stop:2758 length:1449 start_codon:yes stop_codon:yes gene_type:complete
MNIVEEVQNVLYQSNFHFKSNQKLVVAVSGGPDSICLLDALVKISADIPFKIHVVHINHKLRKDESDIDEKYVHDYCKKSNIIFHSESLDIPKLAKTLKQSIETTARTIRYEKLFEYCKNINSNFLLTAHNANDSVETVMMNFIRGSGLRGLKGILLEREINEIKLIRPLINIQRKDIDSYLNQNSIKPRIDSSNDDIQYTRNNIRKNTLPILEKLNPGLQENLLQLSKISFEIDDYFQKIIKFHLEKSIISSNLNNSEYKNLIIDRNYFNNLEKIIQSYLVDKIFTMVTNSSSNHLNYQLIQNAIHLINNKSGRKINLPENTILEVDYTTISIYKNNPNTINSDINPSAIKLDGSITKFGNWILHTEKIENINSSQKLEQIINIAKEKKYEGYFDYDSIGNRLFIRYRNIGDKFEPIGLSGHQSLKKFMSNRHIPMSQRSSTPIITNGSKILWVIPYQTSQFARITHNTTTILKISVTNKF